MTHPIFTSTFSEWHRKAGVFSATPQAPVVPDPPAPSAQAARWARLLGFVATLAQKIKDSDAGTQGVGHDLGGVTRAGE